MLYCFFSIIIARHADSAAGRSDVDGDGEAVVVIGEKLDAFGKLKEKGNIGKLVVFGIAAGGKLTAGNLDHSADVVGNIHLQNSFHNAREQGPRAGAG